MDFAIPTEIQEYLAELDAFIERAMKPLEAENPQFFESTCGGS
jgi:acyl-CoA dehydrogenase